MSKLEFYFDTITYLFNRLQYNTTRLIIQTTIFYSLPYSKFGSFIHMLKDILPDKDPYHNRERDQMR
jgi:hypothetical protein